MSLSLPFGMQNVFYQKVGSSTILSMELQNDIKQGKAERVSLLLSLGVSANDPLPNGELPLHFAVRVNEPGVVSALLEKGADPEQKDFQNLSAIDHTVLMKNESMLANILGHKIGKELKEVQEQIICKGSATHVTQLQNKIQTISNIDVQKHSGVNRAAYLGDTDVFSKVASQDLNHVDGDGLTPLHYAILGNQNGAVDTLIKLGSNINTVDKEGNSLLHYAAINGSKTILNKLIGAGIDPNSKNSNGETALHYAAAKENLAAVEILVKAGANPSLLSQQGMSALSLIGSSAYARDPLSLPKTQLVLFATTSLYWLSTMPLLGDWAQTDEAKATAVLLLLASSVALNWSEFAVLITNLNNKWKKVLAWICMIGLSAIPPLNVGFQAWSTYHVARSAFEGLKKCWHNVGYRNWAVARNVVVLGVNSANSTYKFYATCAATYELFLNAPYLLKIYFAMQSNDEEAFFEAYTEYLRFLRERYNIGEEIIDVSNCATIDPAALIGLTTVERLRKPELNPQCPEHALMMMSPDLNMDQLREQGAALYRKAFRDMMLKEVHPDKAGASEEIKEAAVRLNAARDTLDRWVERNAK